MDIDRKIARGTSFVLYNWTFKTQNLNKLIKYYNDVADGMYCIISTIQRSVLYYKDLIQKHFFTVLQDTWEVPTIERR